MKLFGSDVEERRNALRSGIDALEDPQLGYLMAYLDLLQYGDFAAIGAVA